MLYSTAQKFATAACTVHNLSGQAEHKILEIFHENNFKPLSTTDFIMKGEKKLYPMNISRAMRNLGQKDLVSKEKTGNNETWYYFKDLKDNALEEFQSMIEERKKHAEQYTRFLHTLSPTTVETQEVYTMNGLIELHERVLESPENTVIHTSGMWSPCFVSNEYYQDWLYRCDQKWFIFKILYPKWGFVHWSDKYKQKLTHDLGASAKDLHMVSFKNELYMCRQMNFKEIEIGLDITLTPKFISIMIPDHTTEIWARGFIIEDTQIAEYLYYDREELWHLTEQYIKTNYTKHGEFFFNRNGEELCQTLYIENACA